jgi:hypothetical protein
MTILLASPKRFIARRDEAAALARGETVEIRRLVTTEWLHGFDAKKPFNPTSGRDDFVTFSEPYTSLFGEPVWFYSWGNVRWLRNPWPIGSRWWVAEAFQPIFADGFEHATVNYETGHGYSVRYMANESAVEFVDWDDNITDRRTPSVKMPRWASRTSAEVMAVRIERGEQWEWVITMRGSRHEG